MFPVRAIAFLRMPRERGSSKCGFSLVAGGADGIVAVAPLTGYLRNGGQRGLHLNTVVCYKVCHGPVRFEIVRGMNEQLSDEVRNETRRRGAHAGSGAMESRSRGGEGLLVNGDEADALLFLREGRSSGGDSCDISLGGISWRCVQVRGADSALDVSNFMRVWLLLLLLPFLLYLRVPPTSNSRSMSAKVQNTESVRFSASKLFLPVPFRDRYVARELTPVEASSA